jgi:hypothetical protein
MLRKTYLSVVIHFVSADWQLEKRVIGLRLIDVSILVLTLLNVLKWLLLSLV